jgi:methylisocitrate lyase
MPDLGISTMEDVLTDIRRITDVCDAAAAGRCGYRLGRRVQHCAHGAFADQGRRGRLHIEDQVAAKRCGHRPGKAIVPKEEMVDRVKSAVDARTDEQFVIMARTDSIAVEGMESAIERAQACVEAGADMIFPEAIYTLEQYRQFRAAVKVPILANITEFGQTPLFTRRAGQRERRHHPVLLRRVSRDEQGRAEFLRDGAPRWHAEGNGADHADARRAVRLSRLSRYERKLDELFADGKSGD